MPVTCCSHSARMKLLQGCVLALRQKRQNGTAGRAEPPRKALQGCTGHRPLVQSPQIPCDILYI